MSCVEVFDRVRVIASVDRARTIVSGRVHVNIFVFGVKLWQNMI